MAAARKKTPAKRKSAVRRLARRRPTVVGPAPIVPVATAPVVEIEVEPVRYRITMADCLTVNLTNCQTVTISDDGSYVHVEGGGHPDLTPWKPVPAGARPLPR